MEYISHKKSSSESKETQWNGYIFCLDCRRSVYVEDKEIYSDMYDGTFTFCPRCRNKLYIGMDMEDIEASGAGKDGSCSIM